MDPKNTSRASFGGSSSVYHGVTRHRRTGKYEAYLWDGSCLKDGHTSKGQRGRFDEEEKAARAYDLVALKYWDQSALTNFPIENYERELEQMKNMSEQGYIKFIRRSSTGFSRGRSAYRGVTRHHKDGRWQAKIGRIDGNDVLYLGTFTNEEEAAKAYDVAAIKLRGEKAITNFDTSRYDVKGIMNSKLHVAKKKKRTRVEAENEETSGNNDDFPYNQFGFESTTNVESTENISSCTDCIAPTAINCHAISKTMATTHGLVTGEPSLQSHTTLAAPFSYIPEGLVFSKAPAFENTLSLGTSTFCSPGQSSGLVRTGHESIKNDTNCKTPFLRDLESGPSVGTSCQPPLKFNIWSDIKM
ncbi:hypothetical protein SUGI_0872090 [Cryptomeria japonica]|nr:hypothetical protein SUGI_0872090 [Cryptomeria japonica]